ncbi:unnamed protein product [Phyllotreta striolata]|uniref:RING-type domain-containing protein n=1 Tax=Phyllotreta striolata TaxID=444603 RepID=A0A9N9TSE6_PHYSR|nr:unnamed protein product [Phyllotreta striolata]
MKIVSAAIGVKKGTETTIDVYCCRNCRVIENQNFRHIGCGHLFCLDCINEFDIMKKGSKKCIQCPTCRRKTSVALIRPIYFLFSF